MNIVQTSNLFETFLQNYEKNMEGLVSSYIMAIPFFHNTLISTFLYLFLIKIIFELLLKKKVTVSY